MARRYHSAVSQMDSAGVILRSLMFASSLLLLPLQLPAAEDNLKSLFNFQTRMASQGNVEAMIKLGEMHEEGLGTERSEELAQEWYKKARDKGNPDGQRHLEELANKRQREVQERAARENALREQAAREQAVREQAEREQAMREQAEREQAAEREAAAKKDMTPEEKARAREEAIRRAEEAYQQSLEKQLEKEKAESDALKRARGASSKKKN